jgi:hypothetical protein
MAASKEYPSSPLQPKPKVIDNAPTSSVAGALAASKKQVDQAK